MLQILYVLWSQKNLEVLSTFYRLINLAKVRQLETIKDQIQSASHSKCVSLSSLKCIYNQIYCVLLLENRKKYILCFLRICVCMSSIVSDSLQPHGLELTRLLLSMEFSRQDAGVGYHSPGTLPNPGTEPVPLTSPALARGFFTTSPTWEAWLSKEKIIARTELSRNIESRLKAGPHSKSPIQKALFQVCGSSSWSALNWWNSDTSEKICSKWITEWSYQEAGPRSPKLLSSAL